MKKVGFIISEKEHENRRAVIYSDLLKIKNKENVFFQKEYFDVLGYSDEDVKNLGFNTCEKEDIIKSCDIIIDPKIGDSIDLDKINNKIIFGWVHATQNREITDKLINNKLTVFAWEKMFENNRHVFYGNNQIAGKAAVLHACTCFGDSFFGKKAAVLGNGNTAYGAISTLSKLGLAIDVYKRNMEECFKKEFINYDVIVNCILWDVERKDHILYNEDLLRMKKNSVIIDVSCDHNGGIESSVPTTIDNPIYYKNGIGHYAVDHTPSLLYKEASESISEQVVKYIDLFVEDRINDTLKNCLIVENGVIVDNEINKYQNRKGV